MEKIRNGVFETNSSSTHAIVVDTKTDYKTEIFRQDNEVIEVSGWEYGWEWETYNDFHSKLDYMLTMMQYNDSFFEKVQKLIKDETWIEIQSNFENSDSYVDHSDESIFSNMSDTELMQYLFNINSYVVTCNDNDEDSPDYITAKKMDWKKWYKVFFKWN